MLRLLRIAAPAIFASGALASIAVGCAADPVASPPGVDPSLPGLDASYDPQRVPGRDAGDGDDAAPRGRGRGGDEDGGDGAAGGGPAQGEILITEVMYDPLGAEPAAEWFELYNAGTSPRDLGGLSLVDGAGRVQTIPSGTVIDNGAYVVFARKKSAAVAAKIPESAIVYEYGGDLADHVGVLLANGSTGALYLKNGADVVAQAPYGGWFAGVSGSSIQLDVLDYAAGGDKESWCQSTKAWATDSELGTPGAANTCL